MCLLNPTGASCICPEGKTLVNGSCIDPSVSGLNPFFSHCFFIQIHIQLLNKPLEISFSRGSSFCACCVLLTGLLLQNLIILKARVNCGALNKKTKYQGCHIYLVGIITKTRIKSKRIRVRSGIHLISMLVFWESNSIL